MYSENEKRFGGILIAIILLSISIGLSNNDKKNYSNSKNDTQHSLVSTPIVKCTSINKTILDKTRKTVDQIENIEWLTAKSTARFNNANSFHLYIGKKLNQNWLRFRVQYFSEDWLFIEHILIVTDNGLRRNLKMNFERDNNSKVWEWADIALDDINLDDFRKISTAKKVTIRYYGAKYTKDRDLTLSEKDNIKIILDVYEYLNCTNI